MGDYVRTTRECSLDGLNPILSASIRNHIEKYELAGVATSVLICCETTSTSKKKGFFGGKAAVFLTGILLTPQWLIWASGQEGKAIGVHSARLRDIQVQDYEKSSMNKLVQDTGVNISGLRTDAVDLGSVFIGLGPEPAAQKFRTMLREAISRV
jgi:hypothetical protein